jgi:site-specific DNA recombinase
MKFDRSTFHCKSRCTDQAAVGKRVKEICETRGAEKLRGFDPVNGRSECQEKQIAKQLEADNLSRRARTLADGIEADTDLLGNFFAAGSLAQGRLDLRPDAAALAAALQASVDALSSDFTRIAEPFTLRRRGIETRIIAGETLPAPDTVLQRTLAEAHAWAKALRAGRSLTEIARRTGRSEPYIRARIPLAFLAPHLQAAILSGRQPADFSVAKLVCDGIAMDWK